MWVFQQGSEASDQHSEDDIVSLIEAGTIRPETLIWSPGLASWMPASQVDKFSGFFKPPSIPVIPPPLPVADEALLQATKPASAIHRPIATRDASPWARYFSRMIDVNVFGFAFAALAGAALAMYYPRAFIQMVEMNEVLLGLVIVLAAQVVSAASLTLFHTTPGKALVGIKVLPYVEKAGLMFYFQREMGVWLKGLGLGIPIIALFTMIHQHRRVKQGELASYDIDRSAVVAREGGERLALGFLVWSATIIALVLLTVWSEREEKAVTTSKEWTNPLSGHSAIISSTWEERPIDGSNVVYLASDHLMAEAVVGYEGVAAQFRAEEEYGAALARSLSHSLAINTPWQPIALDGRRVYEARGAHKNLAGVDVLVTIDFDRRNVWRTILFATGKDVADHQELQRLRSQLWSTIPGE